MTVWVVPSSSRNEIAGEYGDALKLKIAAPPEGGRANKAVLAHLSKLTGAKTILEAGATSRKKIVRIRGVGVHLLLEAVAERRRPDAQS